MSGLAIPYFHFVNPKDKLKKEWALDAINWCFYNTDNKNLLYGKDVLEIEGYAAGEFDMRPYKRMFKSIKKKMDETKGMNGEFNDMMIRKADETGLEWSCCPLIPTKLNSAVSVVQKIPVEVSCNATDALAMEKKDEDITFLKNKPVIEADLQDFADQMQLGKVDIGTTKNSFRKFSEAPYGLDLADPDEEEIFVKMLYALGVEVAFEKAIQQFYDKKNGEQVRLLEIKDQFKFGVSVNRPFTSAITQLPDFEYQYPGDVDTPWSELPDYSDNTHRIINKSVTVWELFNLFGDEICSEEDLEKIVNEEKTGYCPCNKGSRVDKANWGTYKMNLKYIEIRSVDWIGIAGNPKSKRGARYFTDDESKCTSKLWGQNTYGFYWLVNTRHVFGIHKLPWTLREKGKESYQNFSTNIYKTQKKSAVELSIGENKKAQIAEIKLQYALIMSLPAGKYVDLRFLRNAVDGLKDEKTKYTQQDLLNLLMEKNIFIGDTEGFDGKNDGQIKPFMDIPGGLKTEIVGYLNVIADASQKISQFTGINEQLTGQSANPEGLVGMQKLLINSSINALYYCNDAMRIQYQFLFNTIANMIQEAIEKGGKTKQAIINMIGIKDTNILDNLNQVPLHDLTIKVGVGQREEERASYMMQLQRLKDRGVITTADEYILSAIENPKERIAYLSIKEKKALKEAERIRQEQYAMQQQLMQQQGQNSLATEQAKTQGDIQVVYAKGEVEAKLIQLSEQLGLTRQQADAIIKRMLQADRGRDQRLKALETIEAKANADQQKAIA